MTHLALTFRWLRAWLAVAGGLLVAGWLPAAAQTSPGTPISRSEIELGDWEWDEGRRDYCTTVNWTSDREYHYTDPDNERHHLRINEWFLTGQSVTGGGTVVRTHRIAGSDPFSGSTCERYGRTDLGVRFPLHAWYPDCRPSIGIFETGERVEPRSQLPARLCQADLPASGEGSSAQVQLGIYYWKPTFLRKWDPRGNGSNRNVLEYVNTIQTKTTEKRLFYKQAPKPVDSLIIVGRPNENRTDETRGCMTMRWSYQNERRPDRPEVNLDPARGYSPITGHVVQITDLAQGETTTINLGPEVREYCDDEHWTRARGELRYALSARNEHTDRFPDLRLRPRRFILLQRRPTPGLLQPEDVYIFKPDLDRGESYSTHCGNVANGRCQGLFTGATPPTGLTTELATVQTTDSRVYLRWNAPVAREDEDPVWGYNIWRKALDVSGADFELVGTLVEELGQGSGARRAPPTFFIDDLDRAGRYEYRIQAYNDDLAGALSEHVHVTSVAAPQAYMLTDDLPIRLSDFNGSRIGLDGLDVIAAGSSVEFEVTIEKSTGEPCDPPGDTPCVRYGGNRQGIALDAGAGNETRWVEADTLGTCIGTETSIFFCGVKPSGSDYHFYPSGNEPSRYLAVWRGDSTTTGFEDGDTLGVHVPASITADRSFVLGFAQVPQTGVPTWIREAGAPAANETIRILQRTKPSGLAVTFQTASRVLLEWTFTSRPDAELGDLRYLGSRVQRRVRGLTSTEFETVGADRSSTVRQILDTLPDTTVAYVYRVGAYYTGGHIGWSGVLEVDPTTQTGATIPPVTFEEVTREGVDVFFSRGQEVDFLLPTATGGSGAFSYRTSDISSIGLRFEGHRLKGTAIPGSRRATLSAVDTEGRVGAITVNILVGDTPDAPTNLMATPGIRSMALTWDAPTEVSANEILGYRIETLADLISGWVVRVESTGTMETSHTVTGLGLSEALRYRVAAVNRDGYGLYSEFVEATTRPLEDPAQPTNVVARGGAGRIDLTWEQPHDGGGVLSGFKIEQSGSGVFGSWNELVANTGSAETEYAHLEIDANRRVYYQVTALTEEGRQSEPSDTVSATTNPPQLPGKITEVEATAYIGRIEIAWTPPPSFGSAIVGYRICWTRTAIGGVTAEDTAACGDNRWRLVAKNTLTPHVHSINHTVVSANFARSFRVAAINGLGLGEWSEVVTATTPIPAERPATPNANNVTLYGGNGQFVITVIPELYGRITEFGYAPSGVSVEYGISDDGQPLDPNSRALWTTLSGVECLHISGELSVNLSRNTTRPTLCRSTTSATLAAGTYFANVVVSANNLPGSRRSSLVGVVGPVTVTAGEVPTAPTGMTTTPGADQITITWTTPERNITHVRIQRLQADGSWVDVVTNHPPNKDTATPLVFSYPHTGLQGGEVAMYWMFARNRNGESAPSAIFAATVNTTAPSTPGGVIVEPFGLGHDAEVRWTAPTSDGGAEIDDYRIEISTNRTNWTAAETAALTAESNAAGYVDTGSNLTRYIVSGRTPRTTEYYRVRAKNATGMSDPSGYREFYVAEASVPSRPRALTVVGAATPPTVTLTWEAPGLNGGAAITAYVIETAPAGDELGTWTRLDTVTADIVTYTHSGLTVPHSRRYRVVAVSAEGRGIPTLGVDGFAGYGLPGAPTRLAAATGRVGVFMAWAAPTDTGGGDLVGYRIERNATSNDETAWQEVVANTGSTDTTYTHTDAGAITNMRYRVQARNLRGPGPASNEITVSTSNDLPDPPTNLVAIVDGNQVELTWDAPAEVGATPITGYRIENSAGDTGRWLVAGDTVDDRTTHTSSARTTAQEIEQDFRYRVIARNSSPPHWSIPSEPITVSVRVYVPPAPSSLTATSEPGAIELEWNAVNDWRGEPVTAYVVESSTAAGPNPVWTEMHRTTDGATTAHTVTIRTRPRERQFRVAAVNRAGVGRFTPTVLGTAEAFGSFMDVNETGELTTDDATIAYYAFAFPELVGDGNEVLGFDTMRDIMVLPHSEQLDTATVLQAVREITPVNDAQLLDVNEDSLFNEDDVLIIYYALVIGDALAEEDESGTPTTTAVNLRSTFLGPLAAEDSPSDDRLLEILDRARALLL